VARATLLAQFRKDRYLCLEKRKRRVNCKFQRGEASTQAKLLEEKGQE